MPIYRTLNHNFFKQWSPAMAYILGYVAADGAVTIGKRRNCYLDIESIDKELIQLMQRILQSNHAIAIRERNKTRSYRLQIGSKNIVSDLIRHGITPQKSKRLVKPKVPKQYLRDFVRGYFDGDGNILYRVYQRRNRISPTKHLRCVFTSCSKRFLVSLHNQLKKYTLLRGGSLFFSGGAYRLAYAAHDSILLGKFMYDNVVPLLYLKRKYKYFILASRKFISKSIV